MNQNTIIGIVAAVVVVAGGAYYFMSQNGAPGAMNSENGSANTNVQQEAQAGAFSGSMTDLLARSGSWKCDIDAAAQTGAGEAISSGSVYVSGGKMRGDFSSSVSGYGTIEAYMISDGEYMYNWSSAYPQGFKAKITASGVSGSTGTSGQGFDANQSYSYNCQPWSADASLFTVPANVTFMELGG